MTETLEPIERVLRAASEMNSDDARKVLKLVCESGMTLKKSVPTEGDKHYARRSPHIKRTKSAVDRVLDYALHETLRKVEKHFRSQNAPVSSAEDDPVDPSGSLAGRLTFNRRDFTDELLAALREEILLTLSEAGQQLFDEVDRQDPWTMPSEQATAFFNYRANLLSGVPDEVHTEVMQSIQEGLNAGESRKQLMSRIRSKVDEIRKGRAETIANTETSSAFNFARNQAMIEAGVSHKKWLHSQSPLIKEPRETHVEHNGQVKPVNEPFNISGVEMMYPTDDTLGAGPEDIINCHCVAIPVESP